MTPPRHLHAALAAAMLMIAGQPSTPLPSTRAKPRQDPPPRAPQQPHPKSAMYADIAKHNRALEERRAAKRARKLARRAELGEKT